MASDSHAKRPIVVERRKEKGRKKTPRLTKTYDVKIIPATVGVVAETEEPPKKRVAAYCRVSTDQEAQETSLEEQMAHFNTVIAEHPDWELAGIYADEGISGTQVKHRVQFQQMIEDAKAKKIDLILTKSISRFARNVVDCLTNIRLLRNLRPPVSVYFDKERLDSLDEKAEVFLTMLASFAQEESRSISTNIKWATRSRMKAGTQKISTTSLLGYDTDDDGEMVIVTNEAEIVRTIYMSFDKGMHPAEIAEKLNALEIRTIKNNPWTGESVKNILRNEKYCGDVLMQKTYTIDCLTHKTKKNEGEVEQYFIPDHHPAIVEREIWDKAQVRLEQIAGKRRRIRPKQQRLVPLRKGVLLGFVPIRPTWKAVSFKRLETATEKVMALVDAKPEQIHIEYESEECEMEILKGFEVINLKQPKGESVMTVTSNSLKFNKATAVELNYAPYIKVLLNAKTRQIAIQPCSEKDPNAIKFSNEESKQTYAISIKVPAIQVEFAHKASSICGQYIQSVGGSLNIKNLIDNAEVKPKERVSRFNNSRAYKPGSIIVNGNALLVAFATLNEAGRAKFFTQDEYIECLSEMWKQIELHCSQTDVCVPILGSGLTLFEGESLSQQELLNIMIWSYKLSPHKIKAPYKLRIICKKSDGFSLNEIDA